MNTLSRTISGGALLLLGFILGYNAFVSKEAFWILLGYGVLLIILGIFVLFNKKEDEIEQIKTQVLRTPNSIKAKGKKR